MPLSRLTTPDIQEPFPMRQRLHSHIPLPVYPARSWWRHNRRRHSIIPHNLGKHMCVLTGKPQPHLPSLDQTLYKHALRRIRNILDAEVPHCRGIERRHIHNDGAGAVTSLSVHDVEPFGQLLCLGCGRKVPAPTFGLGVDAGEVIQAEDEGETVFARGEEVWRREADPGERDGREKDEQG
ncbi:MAG: hypothetical protein L6R40_007590, partial [Gallowayella cf. fulva]